LAAAELALTLQRSAHAKARSAYSGYIAAVLQAAIDEFHCSNRQERREKEVIPGPALDSRLWAFETQLWFWPDSREDSGALSWPVSIYMI
jgi:hypothetical protein